MKQLIVNADDFGFTEDVNTGIIEAHERGILTAATLMGNGRAFDHAVKLAREHPRLDVGCHLVLAGGESLSEPGRKLPATVGRMMAAVAAGGLHVRRELEAQIERILQAEVNPTHLDTHKHTHLYPPVLAVVAELSERYGIKWVRRPFDLPMTGTGRGPWKVQAVSKALKGVRRRFHTVLERHGCRWTDHFAGFQMTGRYRAQELIALLEHLPDGVTEFMCHPGHYGEALRAARTRLKESRQRELEALTTPEVKAVLADRQIRLTCYRELA
ncbi:MAG: ChbG/HpnK family deacetylase [Acidimicrobiia bacterium]|nr:ChbG/HpnK family deacetylase [Acidimicrobiia bacterium]